MSTDTAGVVTPGCLLEFQGHSESSALTGLPHSGLSLPPTQPAVQTNASRGGPGHLELNEVVVHTDNAPDPAGGIDSVGTIAQPLSKTASPGCRCPRYQSCPGVAKQMLGMDEVRALPGVLHGAHAS